MTRAVQEPMADPMAREFLERMVEIEDEIAMLEAGMTHTVEVVQQTTAANLKRVAVLATRLPGEVP